MNTVTGKETVNLTLTVDQVSFIIAGLRDNAITQGKELSVNGHPDDLEMELVCIRENVELANLLEKTMLEQVP